MIRLRWIILVGCTAISAVTAATLGAIFQKQKEKQEQAKNDPNNHHDGLPCCTCQQMRDEATGLGKSLDEFFEKNPSLNRDDCSGDTCAKDYTSFIMPNLVGGSPSTICRTAGGDVTVTQTTSLIVIVPPNPPITGYPATTTAATTVHPGNDFRASVADSTREGSPTTEAPDSGPPQSTGIASSGPTSPVGTASPSDDDTSTQGRPPTTVVIDSETPQSTDIVSYFPTDAVVTASPSDAETQDPISPGPVDSTYQVSPIVSGATPESSDDTIGSLEPSPATSKASIHLPVNMPMDTDGGTHTPITEKPTRIAISGSFTLPSITNERETTGATGSVVGTTESPAATSKQSVHLPVNIPIDTNGGTNTPTSTEEPTRIVISGSFTVPSITTGGDHRTPDPSSPGTTTSDHQASETPQSSAATSKSHIHLPIWHPLPTEPGIEEPNRSEISGSEVPSSTTTGGNHTPDLPNEGTRPSGIQASETPESTTTEITPSPDPASTACPVTGTPLLITKASSLEPSSVLSDEPTSSSGITGASSDFPSETPTSTSTFPGMHSTSYPQDEITTTTPHSIITAYLVTGTALPTSNSPQEPSSVGPPDETSSISGITLISSSLTDEPIFTSIIPGGYSTSSQGGTTSATTPPDNEVPSVYPVSRTALPPLKPVQEPSIDGPVPSPDTTTRASSTFPGGPTSTSFTPQEYPTSPLDTAAVISTTPAEEGTRSTGAPAPVTSPRSGFTTSTTAATPAPTSTAGPTTTTPNGTCRPELGICDGGDHPIHSYVHNSWQSYPNSPPDAY